MTNQEPKKRGRKPGYVMPEATRLKISESQKCVVHSEERRQAMRDAWAKRLAEGYVMSDETKEKMSAAKKGRALTESHKQSLRDAKAKQFSK